MGFALNFMMVRLIGTPSGVPFSQFSYAFYGLASGGNSYSYVFEVHPELNSLLEPEQTLTIYKLAFELIKNHPSGLLQGAIYNWSKVFSNSGYNIFSYISGENQQVNTIARWGLYLLSLLGLIKWIKSADAYISFVVAGTAGVLASVPFVPPADAYGMRLYAASIIIFGLLAMLGLTFTLENLKINIADKSGVGEINSKIVVWYSGIIILILVAGPLIVRGTDTVPVTTTTSCQPDTNSLTISYDPGSSIQVIRQKDFALDWMPIFHQGFFKLNAHGLPDNYLAEWLGTINNRTTLFYTLDIRTNSPAFVVIPTAQLARTGSLMELCGEWIKDPLLSPYYIFVSDNAKSITNGN